LLRDPARRKIIEILGSQGKIGFKELRQELKLGMHACRWKVIKALLEEFPSLREKTREYLKN